MPDMARRAKTEPREPVNSSRLTHTRVVQETVGLLALQPRIGNRAIQAKLEVGDADSPLEAEADAVADRVVGATEAGHTQPSRPESNPVASAEVVKTIDSALGGGQPLAPDVREEMEDGIGADLSAARVHTDSTADELSRSIQAKAFTAGTDVFFKSGAFEPGTRKGKHLLAHELTHVAQQSPAVSRLPDDDDDVEAGTRGIPEQNPQNLMVPGADRTSGSKRATLTASMTPDGKIGSLYFADGTRIRTTHGAGPMETKPDHERTNVRFNIKESLARKEFEEVEPDKRGRDDPEYWSAFDRWMAGVLNRASNAGQLPGWIVRVGAARSLSSDAPDEDTKLFEIFKDAMGELDNWHPSRGAAVRFNASEASIRKVRTYLAKLDQSGVSDPKTRNRLFYKYVQANVPDLADKIRSESEL